MVKVVKDGVIMAVRDEHQLAAFLNNGWAEVQTPILQNVDVPKEEEEFSTPDNSIVSEENSAEKQYTKTDIQRMNKAELVETAKKAGIEGADGMNGTELKENLLKAFNL